MGELPLNSEAEIVKINHQNKWFKARLYEMGLTKGVRVKIKKIAPLGSPVIFEIRGYELGLRKEAIDNIEVRVIR